MVEHKRQWKAALLAGIAACVSACEVSNNPLLLDTVCRGQALPGSIPDQVAPCVTTGDVALTSGASSDVIGVRFGPSGSGQLSIRLNAIAAITAETWTLEALVASTRPEGSTLFRSLTWGSCGATCPSDPPDIEAIVSDDYTWAQVIENVEGTNLLPGEQPVPDDAALIFRGADIDLVDIATPGFEQQPQDDRIPF